MRPETSGQGRPRRSLFLSSVCMALLAFVACGKARDPIPTGITLTDYPGGKVGITSTAQAAQRTIDEQNPIMMRNTSCEAARLLMKAELKKPGYKSVTKNFKQDPRTEFIYDGEYCRIRGLYDPEGKFELPDPGR
ncbi:MAG: hypothetical protein JNM27_06855 [Leptospirales bacterium]|nr:hypothetical protein [Leptospirales bacterium]